MKFSLSTANRTLSVEFSYTDWRAARKRADDAQDRVLENRLNALKQHPTLRAPSPRASGACHDAP